MPDLELLASRLGSAGLLEKPVCGFTKQEVDLLCRSVLEAYGEPLLPGTGETMFFCRYGQRVCKDSVHCRADLYAAGVFTIPSALYGVDFLLPALLQCYGEKLGAFPTNST